MRTLISSGVMAGPDDGLMQSLNEWLRPENVQLLYP